MSRQHPSTRDPPPLSQPPPSATNVSCWDGPCSRPPGPRAGVGWDPLTAGLGPLTPSPPQSESLHLNRIMSRPFLEPQGCPVPQGAKAHSCIHRPAARLPRPPPLRCLEAPSRPPLPARPVTCSHPALPSPLCVPTRFMSATPHCQPHRCSAPSTCPQPGTRGVHTYLRNPVFSANGLPATSPGPQTGHSALVQPCGGEGEESTPAAPSWPPLGAEG